jgi:hypothetical protein
VTDDGPKPPRRFRRPSELRDDEVVEVPMEPMPLTREPFKKLAPTQAEQLAELVSVQRKHSLQIDGFGQAMNRRFDLFHQELALQRAGGDETRAMVDSLLTLVKGNHGPRLGKVEATLGQRAARSGGILAVILLVAPMLAEALPKYAWLFEAVGRALE